jgi:adenylosuccinate synthase
MIADVVVDLQYGDCGKGKVTNYLLETGDYTHCIRYNGGCNAGHTIYHNGEKIITHHIPAGVLHGIKSIIGPGCVVHPEQFFSEIRELEEAGIPARRFVRIARNTHVITRDHVREDGRENSIGTTKRGNGPAYRDKYARNGVRAEDVEALQEFLVDLYEELHNDDKEVEILFEGAQGFGLDVDWGDYPFVTSSHCTTASAFLNGVPPRSLRNVYGVAKMYETYVGAKKFQPKEAIFDAIREAGEEYGATTARPRQCNWMNLNLLQKASRINGVTNLIINKVDVLEEVNEYRLILDQKIIDFENSSEMKDFIVQNVDDEIEVVFSSSKETI